MTGGLTGPVGPIDPIDPEGASPFPDAPSPRPLRLLLSGFGRVGRTLAQILVERPGAFGDRFRVVGITTGASGSLADPAGLDLAAALERLRSRGRFAEGDPGWSGLGTAEAARTLGYDVLVELSPLSVAGRGEPALGYCRTALDRGRHVVSANKGPVAWGYSELSALAAARGVRFRFESTVMDGAPVFNLVERCLPGATVERFEGVLNSTTNVILSELERGLGFDAALERARQAGVVEANPEDDLAGWDAAVKAACLARVLLGAEIPPEEVERTDIRDVDPARPAGARERGTRLKLVAEGERTRGPGGPRVRVRLRELPLEDPLAQVAGTSSALRLVTDLPGRLVVVEEGPDLRTTAYGVLADLASLTG
ncbi:MAG: homoserine dehydrogenase [Acidobacteriota bacterium]|jgi:homoserine dehydrogenase